MKSEDIMLTKMASPPTKCHQPCQLSQSSRDSFTLLTLTLTTRLIMTQWNNIKQVSTEFETKEGSFYLASVVLVFILINNSKGGRPCHKA